SLVVDQYHSSQLLATVASYNSQFLCRFDRAGTRLVYSKYLGSVQSRFPEASLAVDAAGNAYVARASHQFGRLGEDEDVRIIGVPAEVPTAGPDLLFDTYLSGEAEDSLWGACVDRFGDLYVSGSTLSHDFPAQTTLGTPSGPEPPERFWFVTKIAP